ncbi:MAG TPA: hypothetical protein VJ183_01005 [Chloroflexia bacterium]|nr:hypothetical protein [Chloroflexia bacterium]
MPSTYPIEVKINPDRSIAESDYTNNDATKQAVFIEPFNLRIGYVRIGYHPPGSANVVWPTGPLETYTQTLRNIYPIDQAHLQYYELPFRLNSTLTLATFAEQSELLDRMERRYTRLRSRIGDLTPDLMIGYLAWQGHGPTNVFTQAVGLAYTGSHLLISRAAWVIDYNGGGGVDSSERVLAHEVGHLLTLHHTGTPDPAPCWGPSRNNIPGYWEFGTGHTWEIGYDGTTGNLVSDLFYDVLNYCPANQTWISKFHYNRLFEGMRRYDFNDPDLMPDFTLDDALVSGSLAHDGNSGHLDPLYRVASSGQSVAPYKVSYALGAGLASPLTRQQQQGENCIRFTGASGTLSERCFDVSFENEETGNVRDVAGFSLRVPYPNGTTGVTLLRNGKELDRLSASANTPNLTITSPKAGDTWDGPQQITWTASDADGDALTYEVHYSPNGREDWFPLELDLQGTQYIIDTSQIAGGDNVIFRVLASDGFHTAQAEVGPIKVPSSPPFKAPERTVKLSGSPPTQPPTPGSGPGALLFVVIGLGLALLVATGWIITLSLSRRSRVPQAPHLPAGFYPSQPPVYGPPATSNPFARAEHEYHRLKAELAAGRINLQQFDASMRRLSVRDAQGRTWMLARDTGQWFLYDGRAWVPGRPY